MKKFFFIFFLIFFLVNCHKKSAEKEFEKKEIVVSAVKVAPKISRVPLRAYGRVVSKDNISLRAKVNGVVVWLSDKLKIGGRFKKGEIILKIKDTPYKTAFLKAEQELTAAKIKLKKEIATAEVATQAWFERFGSFPKDPLVSRELFVKEARELVKAAIENFKKAKQDLLNTKLKAPFPLVITSKNVSQGTYLRAGEEIAKAYDSKNLELRLAVPETQMRLLTLPSKSNKTGSLVHIYLFRKSKEAEDKPDLVGNLLRTEGTVDEKGAVVWVRASLPLAERYPLLAPGAFSVADIFSKPLKHIVKIPLEALRKDNLVLAVRDNKIYPIKVNLILKRGKWAYAQGIKKSELIIVSPVPYYTKGMKVKIKNG